jgi:glucosamine-6-phosphate deaminase
VVIKDTSQDVADWVAAYVVKRISDFVPTPERPRFVLGLPTGSSPLLTYKKVCAHACRVLSRRAR